MSLRPWQVHVFALSCFHFHFVVQPRIILASVAPSYSQLTAMVNNSRIVPFWSSLLSRNAVRDMLDR